MKKSRKTEYAIFLRHMGQRGGTCQEDWAQSCKTNVGKNSPEVLRVVQEYKLLGAKKRAKKRRQAEVVSVITTKVRSAVFTLLNIQRNFKDNSF
jgi:hypothetical protein